MRLITENSIISEQGDLNTEGRDWWSHRGLNVFERACSTDTLHRTVIYPKLDKYRLGFAVSNSLLHIKLLKVYLYHLSLDCWVPVSIKRLNIRYTVRELGNLKAAFVLF